MSYDKAASLEIDMDLQGGSSVKLFLDYELYASWRLHGQASAGKKPVGCLYGLGTMDFHG